MPRAVIPERFVGPQQVQRLAVQQRVAIGAVAAVAVVTETLQTTLDTVNDTLVDYGNRIDALEP